MNPETSNNKLRYFRNQCFRAGAKLLYLKTKSNVLVGSGSGCDSSFLNKEKTPVFSNNLHINRLSIGMSYEVGNLPPVFTFLIMTCDQCCGSGRLLTGSGSGRLLTGSGSNLRVRIRLRLKGPDPDLAL